MEGCVYKSTGSWYSVKGEDGVFYKCRIKGKLRIQGIRSTNPVSVGDIVFFELDEDNMGVISGVKTRTNAVVRKSVNLSKKTHIIAANIDLCILLITLKEPITTTGFVDRFLASAEAFQVPVLLVFNKMDLYPEIPEMLDEWVETYRKAGYEISFISVAKQTGIDALKDKIKGKTIVLSGHSGAGKSSLLQAIAPEKNVRIGNTSDVHKKGKHTTTFAEMYDLPHGSRLIDTPGIKGFGITEINKQELAMYFREFREKLPACKFYNCTHLNEPGCAVKKALTNQEIAQSRYKNYVNMMNEEENSTYRKDIYGA